MEQHRRGERGAANGDQSGTRPRLHIGGIIRRRSGRAAHPHGHRRIRPSDRRRLRLDGSVTLLGGEPGIGKSTLLIQACAELARRGARVIYISGEEAVAQVRLRAARLGLADSPVELASATHVEDILATCSAGRRASLIIIDSIQTMHTETVDSARGTVTQVRASAQALLRHAKQSGSSVILVGHVTKDGQVAGPRVVEHMVDAVLSFEGDGAHHFRMLRASKNRFGATGEIGVFEMTGLGLAEVANPSALFLAGRDAGAPGAARRSRAWKASARC